MKILKKMKFIALLLIVLLQFVFIPPSQKAYAATSPTLGDADSFSILAATLISNANPASTTITGNVGSTGGGAAIGVACTSMNGGTIYSVDAAPIDTCVVHNSALPGTAQTANTAAYGNLVAGDNAPAGCTNIPVELGGQTLPPGLYCSGGVFTLNGTLTLSGSGVWIFQSTATLVTVGAAAKVVGGDPCNVWWRVPSSATLGTGSSLIGNILALTSITIQSGASLNGRALSQTGAVTLDGNTITKAVCAAAPTPTSNGFGLPGDNQSDHRSDGRSSPPAISATTNTLAATGSNDQSIRIILAATAALFSFLLGKALLRRHETS